MATALLLAFLSASACAVLLRESLLLGRDRSRALTTASAAGLIACGVLTLLAADVPDLTAWTSNDYSAAASVGTFLIAVAATLIARRQLIQARQLREEESAPFIIVDVVPSHTGWQLDLVIENIGKTPAKDVRITFSPPVEAAVDDGDYRVAEWSPLKDGIKSMAPGRRLSTLFDSRIERDGKDLPQQYEVVITYTDLRGRRQPSLPYTIDLAPFFGGLHEVIKGTHEAVTELEKIRKAIEPITKKRLTVETFDGEAENEKRAEMRAEQRRRHAELTARLLPPADPAQDDPPSERAVDGSS